MQNGLWMGGGMSGLEQLRDDLGAAVAGAGTALAAADRLCLACVQLLEVDGAAVSLMYDGSTRGTFGSSGELSRRLDEFQFTFGEGPCLDAVFSGAPVLVSDLSDAGEQRWPAFRGAMLDAGMQAVFAMPVVIASAHIGALDLFRKTSGSLTNGGLSGGLMAAKLAALPLLDLMTSDVDWDSAAQGDDGWEQLASLERVEVYQATGMIIARLEIDAAEALVRLRAYAFARGLTASEASWAIVEKRVTLDGDGWRRGGGTSGFSR
jgi:hypothetical protein